MTRKFDFLIIGSGVAGMSYALKVARAKKGKIAIICKTTLEEANTAKAQGGIASVTNLLNNKNLVTTAWEQYRFDYTNYNVNKYANKYYYAFGTTFYLGINFQM